MGATYNPISISSNTTTTTTTSNIDAKFLSITSNFQHRSTGIRMDNRPFILQGAFFSDNAVIEIGARIAEAEGY